MKNLAQLHGTHKEIMSELQFLNVELRFLISLIKKEYNNASSQKQVKLLDAYYLEFEKNITKTDKLLSEINDTEKNFARLTKHGIVNIERTFINDEDRTSEQFGRIKNEILLLKQSFYDFVKEELGFVVVK
ncbi:MAG: hypothetical protein ACK40G_05495 [Cytophagaceae bacterium]